MLAALRRRPWIRRISFALVRLWWTNVLAAILLAVLCLAAAIQGEVAGAVVLGLLVLPLLLVARILRDSASAGDSERRKWEK